MASVQHHLTPSSSVFDRQKFIKDEIPSIMSETRQINIQVSTYLLTDISKWKTDMTAWLDNISDALTTATTRLPQLTEQSLHKHRFDIVLSMMTEFCLEMGRILLVC
jgi:hypothetical protein